MSREIIIVGGLDDEPNREVFLELLVKVSGEVRWEWLSASSNTAYQLDPRRANSVFNRLGKWSAARKRNVPIQPDIMQVVKLYLLNGKAANNLFRVFSDPIPAPKECASSAQLLAWLVSAEAGLFPPQQWNARPIEGAIVAIVCKLLKKSSIAGGHGGHNWTLEDHLLNEAPVTTTERPAVAIEARRILDSLKNVLLYSKGSNQGNTPKEWAIARQSLPHIKRMLVTKDVTQLQSVPGMASLLKSVTDDTGDLYNLDDIVTERVRAECR